MLHKIIPGADIRLKTISGGLSKLNLNNNIISTGINTKGPF
jgi:hypothetical protein